MIFSYRRASRLIFAAIFVVCAALLAAALYMQYVLNLYPCNLCLLQRFMFIGMGVVGLVGALHGAKNWGARLYALLILIFAIGGIATAGRQVWLQSLPAEQVPACGMGLEYMMQVYPLFEALWRGFQGSGDCAKVQWQFLGLSIPWWSLLFFIANAVVALAVLFYRQKSGGKNQ